MKGPGRGQRWIQRLSAGILIVSLLCFTAGAEGREAPQERKLRVGFPLQQGLAQVDSAGDCSGYTYEYLQEIAQYTGWTYEFVTIGGSRDFVQWEMLRMLERGELDLLGSMDYDDTLAARFDYPGLSYGTSSSVLAVLEGNTAITESNFQMIDGLRIAVRSDDAEQLAQLERFCSSHQIDHVLIPCPTWSAMLERLQRGGADALLGTDITLEGDLKVVAKFSPRVFYFATTQGNTEIVNKLNTAILKINESDPYFSASLYEKYFGAENALQLSDAEDAFVRQQPPLQVAYVNGKAPIQFMDKTTGEFSGVAREIFDYIASHTGLRFRFTPVEDQAALIALLQDGGADLVASIPYDYDTASLCQVSLTRPYLSSQILMAVNRQVDPADLGGKRLALPMGISEKGADTNLVTYYDTVQACLDAVERGDADYSYGNGYTFQYYASQPQYKNLTLIPNPGLQQSVSIGVAKPADVTLLTLLNKAIRNISADEMQVILYRNAVYAPSVSFESFVAANPMGVFWGVVGLAALIIGALLWNLHTRAAFSRKLASENARYLTLCEISNEYLFEYDFARDALLLSEPCAQCFHCRRELTRYRTQVVEHMRENRESVRAFFKTLEEQERASQEQAVTMADGSIRWFRITARATRDQEGHALFCVGKVADIQEEWEARNRLEERARRDSLTNVYNAACCRQQAAEKLRECGGALLLLDIDHFKQVNDEQGHYTGDQVLMAVADLLASKFRCNDVVGRPGGDEFLIFMTGVTDRAAVEEKCRSILQESTSLKDRASGMPVTLSIGVAMSEAGGDYEPLFKRADGALYRVKDKGRDGYCFAET